MRHRSARLCATTFSLAMLLGALWWSSFWTMVVLHDDAAFVEPLSRTLDRPEVRAQLGEWTTDLITQASTLSGEDLAKNPLIIQLDKAFGSDREITPLVTAATAMALQARDAAVTQLAAHSVPKQPVTLDLSAVFAAADIPIDQRTAQQLGLPVHGTSVVVPLLSAEQLDQFQQWYDWIRLTKNWAGWAALALLVVALITSARPLGMLAVAAGVMALLALAAPVVLSRLTMWVGGNETAAVLRPLVAALEQQVKRYSPTVIIVGGVLCVVFALGQWMLNRRMR